MQSLTIVVIAFIQSATKPLMLLAKTIPNLLQQASKIQPDALASGLQLNKTHVRPHSQHINYN